MGRKPKTNKTFETFKIKFKGGDDFEKLNESLEFKNVVYKEVALALSYAIKNKRAKMDLFNLEDFGLTISVKKTKYKSVLDKTIAFYTQQENFEKCTELTKLKEKL